MKKFDFVPQNVRSLNQKLILLFASILLSVSVLSASSSVERTRSKGAGPQPQVQAQPADIQPLHSENLFAKETSYSVPQTPNSRSNINKVREAATQPSATQRQQAPRRQQVGDLEDTAYGNAAFALGITAIAALLLGIFLPVFLLLWPIAAVLAIVFGAIGLKRSKKGDKKAKVGLWLGIIALIVPVLVIVVAILLMLLWEVIKSNTYWF
jgi:hypothetical protein